MYNPLDSTASKSIGMLIARLPVGLVLAWAGYIKVFKVGVANFYQQAHGLVPDFMPEWFGALYLKAVPYAELGLGVLLVAGLFTRLSALLGAAMLASFGLAIGLNSGVQPSLGGPEAAATWEQILAGFINFDEVRQGGAASAVLQAPLIYGAFALIIFFVGPGSLSVDRVLFGKSRPPAND